MIAENINRTLLSIFIFTSCTLIKAQTVNKEFVLETDTIHNQIIKIELPSGYKKIISNYDEGIFIDYNYEDSSLVTIFKGSLHKIPLLDEDMGYIPQSIDTLNHKIITKGVLDNKAWREDSFKGIRIIYDRVPLNKAILYDEILNNFHLLNVNINTLNQ